MYNVCCENIVYLERHYFFLKINNVLSHAHTTHTLTYTFAHTHTLHTKPNEKQNETNPVSAALSAASVDTFGLPTVSSTSLSTSHSLNSNAIVLAVSLANTQPVIHLPPPSKLIDANHSLNSSTITSFRTSQHFNIDEFYIPNDVNRNLGKAFIRSPQRSLHPRPPPLRLPPLVLPLRSTRAKLASEGNCKRNTRVANC